MKRNTHGFTLVELLAVVMIIAILAGIMMGAASLVSKNARKQTADSGAASLRLAVTSYRHSLNHWPIPDNATSFGLQTALDSITTGGPVTNAGPYWTVGKGSDGVFVIFSGPYNYLAFDMLRYNTVGSPPPQFPTNRDNIHFIDDSAVFADSLTNGITRRLQLPHDALGALEAGHPIVYDKGGSMGYYTVRIDFDLEVCTVGK